MFNSVLSSCVWDLVNLAGLVNSCDRDPEAERAWSPDILDVLAGLDISVQLFGKQNVEEG